MDNLNENDMTGFVRPVRGATANIGSIMGLDGNERGELKRK